jgi:preprotein translocase subunit YajC
MDSLAHAMGIGGTGGGDAGGMSAFIPLILMFAIFYFLLIRPQQKKAKQTKAMLASVRKGDRIVTAGGLHGVITGVADDIVTMEIAPKIRVKVSRGSVAGILKRDESVSTQE